jgi:hypothetical protein
VVKRRRKCDVLEAQMRQNSPNVEKVGVSIAEHNLVTDPRKPHIHVKG